MTEHTGQLLCTFSTFKTYESEIDTLTKVYKISGDKVYVLCNMECADEIFLTFNGTKLGQNYHPKTISVHRKKDYNVLYSINALNELVQIEYSGSFSANTDVNWENYRNSLIIMRDGKLKVIPTKLLKIFRI